VSTRCCCVQCFDHAFVQRHIAKHGAAGECGYCAATDVSVLDPADLTDLFEPLLTLFEPTEAGVHYDHREQDAIDYGEPLGDLLNDRWSIFSDRLYSNVVGETDSLHDLVEDILAPLFDYKDMTDVGAGSLWSDKEAAFSTLPIEMEWRSFKYDVKYRRRFLLAEASPDTIDIRSIVSNSLLEELEEVLPKGTRFHRARLGANVDDSGLVRPLARSEVGPPPRDKARAGRVNPEGIPMLYVATDSETAVAECRPWKGALVTVTPVTLDREVRLVDLARAPDFADLPFGTTDLEWDLKRERVLQMFGEDLALPVNPETSVIEYVPTQYVAELIRGAGYDGIRYRSALGNGTNVVLFEPFVARIGNRRKVVRVTGVSLQVERATRVSVDA
jgi:hypothetical protein